jgi:16S rRNA (guanine527-N7)-methyltransferase
MDFIEFWTVCSANKIILSEEQMDNMRRFHKELIYWNEKVNMVSRKDIDFVLAKHILHSLTIMRYIDIPERAKVIDIGTGGGLPGIPLKIANPTIYLTLIDSITKKIKIVEMLAKHTGLRNIEAKAVRAEVFAQNPLYQNKFDLVVSRAVAPASKIFMWTQNLLKKNGKIILWKGGDLSSEIEDLKLLNNDLKISEITIDFFGYDYFKQENKKLLIIEL